MAGKAGNSKKPRTKGPNASRARGSSIKTGFAGARKTRLSPLEKALMGGGAMRNISKPLARDDGPVKVAS